MGPSGPLRGEECGGCNYNCCSDDRHKRRNAEYHPRLNIWTRLRLPSYSIYGVLTIFVVLISCQLQRVEANRFNNNNLNQDYTDSGGSSEEGVEEIQNRDSFDDDNNNDLQLNLIGNVTGLDDEDEDRQHYTHQWAAHIVGGKLVADRISRKLGFHNAGEVREILVICLYCQSWLIFVIDTTRVYSCLLSLLVVLNT